MNARKFLAVAMLGLATAAMVACDDDEPAGPEPEVFTAALTGTAERPNPVTTNATGTARVEFTTTGLTFRVTVANIANVTAAHIHSPFTVDQSGGVTLNFNVPNPSPVTNGVLIEGTATAPSAATLTMDSLKAHIRTGRAYVNVHNTANPGGHIRGQLIRQP